MKPLYITAAFATLYLGSVADQLRAEKKTSPVAEAAAEADLLRFSNGDTLHGLFLGFDENSTIIWKNPQSPDPIHFSTKKIHRIVLNRGHAHQKTDLESTLTLINGDILAGTITSAETNTITLISSHLGTLTIPMETVSTITPNPHGGKLFYYGPLRPEGWKIISPEEGKKDGQDKKDDEDDEEKVKKGEDHQATIEQDEENQVNAWKHVANAWYTGANQSHYLMLENALPDKCRLSFKLAWRGSIGCDIAIHADFSPPAYQGEESLAEHLRMIATPGHSYIVRLTRYNAELYSCTFDETGKPSNTRVDNSRISLNFLNSEEATFEFRIDKSNKQFLLYVDGDFKAKWDLGKEYHGIGKALGFYNLNYKTTSLRVSDILISPWNGLKDSAHSMRNRKRDTILLTNGIDRFSGTFNHIKDGNVSFLGSYGNQVNIPVDEVQEIHLASDKLLKPPEDPADMSVYFHIPPYGRISGVPEKSGDAGTVITSDILGKLNLRTNYANMIDFSHQNNLLDLWDDNF